MKVVKDISFLVKGEGKVVRFSEQDAKELYIQLKAEFEPAYCGSSKEKETTPPKYKFNYGGFEYDLRDLYSEKKDSYHLYTMRGK